MLGKRVLDKSRVTLTEDAYEQWKLVVKELDILCNKTGMSWDLADSKLVDKVRRVCFTEGIVVGVGIVIGAMALKHYRKDSETEEV